MALAFENLEDFDKFLSICRKHDVTVVKDGDQIIQFQPKMPDFAEPEVGREVQAGGWKRNADLMD